MKSSTTFILTLIVSCLFLQHGYAVEEEIIADIGGRPVKNIEVSSDKVIFFENCSSCQRCVHKCPKNAFLHKNKIVEQYKLKH